MEPGRSISANAGVLLTIYLNQRHIVTSPLLMQQCDSSCFIWSLDGYSACCANTEEKVWDLVGAICETGDVKIAHSHYKKMTCWLYSVLWFCHEFKLQHAWPCCRISGEKSYLIRERETVESLKNVYCLRSKWDVIRIYQNLGNDFMVVDLISQRAYLEPFNVWQIDTLVLALTSFWATRFTRSWL